MLKLKDLKKSYKVGTDYVEVLKGINLDFKENQFVSILGQSGCGKTTLLNVIGGLDQYDSGDIIINNKSTKDFSDSNWDSYRNETLGFIFQSYNLISHLSILENVAIALSLSGVSSDERTKRAKDALTQVGLEDHFNKRPNQLSGGQMQRVAIARALINDPKIILADEPTGALDTETSVQIMKLIKEISKTKLVIMVTHNPELAEEYSDRIIKVLDGKIIEDSIPYVSTNNDQVVKYEPKKTSMSYLTALKSSFKNLMCKKARTIITAFAGSIGIIGVALVLSLSTGMTNYITDMQTDALSTSPISISQSTMTRTNSRNDMMGTNSSSNTSDNSLSAEGSFELYYNVYNEDVLGNGYTFIEYIEEYASQYYTSISYGSGYTIKALVKTEEGIYKEVSSSSIFYQLSDNKDYVLDNYDLIGDYPTSMNQIVLVVDSSNTLSKSTMESLGLDTSLSYSYDDILGLELSVVTNDNYYINNGTSFSKNVVNETLYNTGDTISISGILKIKDDSSAEILSTGLNYTSDLADYLYNIDNNSKIVNFQKDKDYNVVTGVSLNDNTYLQLMQQLGGDDTPSSIDIFPITYEDKDSIKEVIEDYNDLVKSKYSNTSSYVIVYTDFAEMMGEMMTSMIDTISLVLTGFASISLVVSSIMIGIITYVSVVERTKEIGILRAIGARKKDISRIFNAEAISIGFLAGTFGIIITFLLSGVVNSVAYKMVGVENISSLTISNAVLLITLSVGLTLIAGLIPSKIASKMNPVTALRSE